MAGVNRGPFDMSLTVDSEGYREYKVSFKVTTTDRGDGPAVVYETPGLPLPGAAWAFFGNELDAAVWCRKNCVITKRQNDDSADYFWQVDKFFSNRPDPSRNGCADENFEYPLLEPAKWSGSFIKYIEEATHDRFGIPILTSSHEQIRGSVNEWDRGRPTIRIEHNVPSLDLALLVAMIDTVNSEEQWGFPPRTLKLSQIAWQELWYGTCDCYYKRIYDYEANFDTWDREVLDEGSKVLNGKWDPDTGFFVLQNIGGLPPDHTNPNHFVRAEDRKGNPIKLLLDGTGRPAEAVVQEGTGTGSNPVATITIQKYYGADQLLLGLPTSLCSFGQAYSSIIKSVISGTVSLQGG